MDNAMKLYLVPNFCSLSPHLALREAGLPFSIEPVEFANKTLRNGGDFRRVNPKGAVPALELEDGRVLTEGAAISIGSRADQEDMIRAIDVNRLKPVIDRRFPLQEIVPAFEHYESQKHFGKVCIEL